MSTRTAELAALLIRNIDQVPMVRETRLPLYDSHTSRLARGTAARKLGASYDVLEPGKRGCPYHLHHAQEEMFVILEGAGTLRVAGELLPIKAGDIIFIPAGREYPHQIINTSGAQLKYLSVSTRESPEIAEYPDSDKFLTYASDGQEEQFRAMSRSGEDIDYWDGEP